MRWDFGAVYKEIRKSKGLSQADVCGEVLSRTSLAKIESGKTTPKFENMEFLLRQINMSFEEFDYICHLYQPNPRSQILIESDKIVSVTGTTKLEKLLQNCKDYLRSNHDIPIQHIHDLLSLHIRIIKKGVNDLDQESQQLTERFWNYLEKQDTWYMNDFRIFSSILYSIPIEHIHLLTDKVLNNLDKYKDFRSMRFLTQNILMNLSTIYFYNYEFDKAQQATEKLWEIAQLTKQYDSLALCYVRRGLFHHDEDSIQKGLQLLEITEEKTLLETLKKEVKLYREHEKKSKND